MTVKVPPKVKEAIEAVRVSGVTNMVNRGRVVAELDRLGQYEAVVWVHENREDYIRGFFEGYETDEKGERSEVTA